MILYLVSNKINQYVIFPFRSLLNIFSKIVNITNTLKKKIYERNEMLNMHFLKTFALYMNT